MPVPPSGTIRILGKQIFQKSGNFSSGLPTVTGFPCPAPLPNMTDTDIAAYLNADIGGSPTPNSNPTVVAECNPACFGLFPPAGLYLLKLSPASDEIIFNPGGSQQIIDILSGAFPMGVLIGSLQVVFIGTARKQSAADDIIDFHLVWGNTNVHTIALPNINNGTVSSGSGIIIPAGTRKGIITALTFLGVDATHVAGSQIFSGCGTFDTSQAQFAIRNLRFTMTYVLWTTTLSNSPSLVFPEIPTQSPSDTIFSLVDSDPIIGKLTQLNELNAYYVNPNGTLSGPFDITILTQSPALITYQMSNFTIPAGAQILVAGASPGPVFTGETIVASIHTNLVDGSGIYTLVPGKRNDTYYDRSVTPSTTIDLAIPTPRAKTGFFNA